MKKFISGLIAAFLLSAGFVAVSAETASAACGTQYVPCVATHTKATAKPVTQKQKPVVQVQITANGNVKPIGVIVIKVGKKSYEYNYRGGKVNLKLPKLKPGTYKATVSFHPAKISNFKASSKNVTIKVKKK